MAVGIFDSGLGGLTVHNAVSARLPDVPFVYYGDSAHAPYGVRDADDVYNLTTRAVERLWDEGCDLVILACNTASAAALRRMQENWIPTDKRVLGVFVPLIEALTERQWGDNSPPSGRCAKRRAIRNARNRGQPRISAGIGVSRDWCRCRSTGMWWCRGRDRGR